MRLLVACDDSGSVKEIICNKGTDTANQQALQPFHNDQHLAEGLNNRVEMMLLVGSAHLLLARANGVLQLVSWNKQGRELTDEQALKEPQFDVSTLAVVSTVDGLFDEQKLVELHKMSKKRSTPKDGFVTLCMVPGHDYLVFCATRSGSIHIFKLDAQAEELERIQSHKVNAPLEFAQIYDLGKPTKDLIFAYGGEENLVKLAELSENYTQVRQLWESKNVKNDRLDLRVPIWPMQLKFLEPAKNSTEGAIDYQFVTVSRLSHFRKYQTTHGRKPLTSKSLLPKDEPISELKIVGAKMSPLGNIKKDSFSDFSFITTDFKKNVLMFDADGTLQGKFGNGDITGCPSFIDVYNQKYLLEGGLDRYARVYHLKTRKLLCKCYTGAKISCLTVLDDKEVEIPEIESDNKKKKKKRVRLTEQEHTIEDEELWGQLDKNRKRSRKE